ncbi:pyrroloquinoline quinone biosynthesis protein PqqB [Methylocapsa acidiphila]|uniref:pyrroloquinoline quinone biosynthesis protein PqqB n=1 Tax=Methylocapsa acidiphila TaxID=133552 RepID=UPI000425D91A|nr:pyrroloquinoline quinone biosynthesis protein PqqB [Methylocapsa acidiphila]
MQIRILGSSAGGGFPQWNCNCRNCAAARAGAPGFRPRTQSSLAVSRDGRDWVLLNASPDLGAQLVQNPALAARADGPARNSPIKAVILTNGDVDHVAGLLTLREAQPFAVYGAQRVLDVLARNALFDVLAPERVERRVLAIETPTKLAGGGVDLGLTVEAFPVEGKIALYLEDAAAGPNFGTQIGDTLGLRISDPATGDEFFYVPGCAKIDETLARRLRGAKLAFFDGTLWHDDEMIEQGLLGKTGARMGHVNMSGPEGSIASFAPLGVARKVYIHINNSNPVLNEFSPERKAAEAAGWEIGYDGMELSL